MPEQDTPRVDRLCILALAVEWTLFGSCHFADLPDTIREIPGWVPAHLLTFVALSTGMVEVATGILILFPQTRKGAALVSLALLSAFLFAIYKILANPAAFPDSFSPATQTFVRVILVPNHISLALCAIHLLQKRSPILGPAQVLEGVLPPPLPRPPLTGTPGSAVSTPGDAGLAATLTVALVMLLANLAGFGAIVALPAFWHHATADLWAMMCLATGALVGFLFGVPRVNSEEMQSATYRPNSNIEQVSDWLTKIIVGVGLIEFRSVGAFVHRVSAELGRALAPTLNDSGSQAQATAFALALIVYFFVAGMIQGYLLTRLYLSKQFGGQGV